MTCWRIRGSILPVLVLSVSLLMPGPGWTQTHRAQTGYAGFPEPQADYDAYVEQVGEYLANTRMGSRREDDVQFSMPFSASASSAVAYRGKFLLIHGLNDSPYVWHDVAKSLTSRGFDVRAILLPGHGNSPEAQLTIRYRQWIHAARQHLALWKNDDVPVYVGGFSLGAVLASTLATENPDIAGLLLFSPAFKSSKSHLLRWSSIYSKFKPWVFGGMIIEDNPTKYNSIPINGAAQYYKATRHLHKRWRGKSLSMPVLMIASEQDSVVDIDHLKRQFNQRFSSGRKSLVLYGEYDEHSLNQHVHYRRASHLSQRILNQSHMSLMNAPGNPVYGREGFQLVCNGNDWPVFSACLYYSKQHWYGAQHTVSPDDVPVARTTYNPDYAFIWRRFDEVFAGNNSSGN